MVCKGSGVVDGVKNVWVTIPAGELHLSFSELTFWY